MLILESSPARVIVKQLGPSVVSTKYGKLRGAFVEFPNTASVQLKPVEAFSGIQYASLRNRALRFLPPTGPVERWNGIESAWSSRAACPQKIMREKELVDTMPDASLIQTLRIAQFTKTQHEDCLTLNVVVPFREWNDTKLMPVMIFIHGESYEIGTGNAYDGSVLASYGEVIVVTVNYRLGVLGFLSTGDAYAPGNYALYDLLAIFSWIKDNIGAFSGDKDRVTLFGHGHGAALVNLFLFSNMAANETYFHRVILQSGSALSSWATSVNPVLCSRRLAQNINCTGYIDTSELLNCLKSKPLEELVQHVPLAPKYYSCFGPVLNRQGFNTLSLRGLMREKKTRFAKTPIIFGITKDESYSFFTEQEIRDGIDKERRTQILRTFVHNMYQYHKQEIFDILDHEYSTWDKAADDASRRNNLIDLLTDGLYLAPLIEMAQEHSKHNDTYLYVFSYSTASENYPKWVKGTHGDELPYIFGAPLVDGTSPFPLQYNNAEKSLSENMMRLWTNFAKTGDPNIPDEEVIDKVRGRNRYQGVKWPKYGIQTESGLVFGEDIGKGPTIRSHYRAREMGLWLNLLPKINSVDKEGKKFGDNQDLSSNMSTFEFSHLLMTDFMEDFPSSPTIVPVTPPLNDKPDGTTNDETATQDLKLDKSSISLHKILNTTTTNPDPAKDLTLTQGLRSTLISSTPLSITVSVGCSVLFVNILIFATVCYQRERIRRGRGEDLPVVNREAIITKERDRTMTRESQELALLVPPAEPFKSDIIFTNASNNPFTDNSPSYKTINKEPTSERAGCSYTSLAMPSSSFKQTNYPANHVPYIEGQLASNCLTVSKPAAADNSDRPSGKERPTKSEHEICLLRSQQSTSNNSNTIV
ncbi:hypothetical protein CHS0354_038985 [Potamilus streckersoni]|uniref:Carboxylesterase type B domain-containing protein n=1 Tax=Potamilus streckersoni TaxID=2493646 RepID=A0AAE0VMR6_9BIVA|nr:hypothetical protein CHS0354_038985 [Potamilus streckersoni]